MGLVATVTQGFGTIDANRGFGETLDKKVVALAQNAFLQVGPVTLEAGDIKYGSKLDVFRIMGISDFCKSPAFEREDVG